MNTIGVVGDVDEISIKIDALLVWTSQQLRRFVHEHDGSCGCSGRTSCPLLDAVEEELSFRLDEDGSNTEGAASVPVSEIPCTANPEGWDLEVADVDQLHQAINTCTHACPIFDACKRQAEYDDPRAMVWAGVPYDADGVPMSIHRLPGVMLTRYNNSAVPSRRFRSDQSVQIAEAS